MAEDRQSGAEEAPPTVVVTGSRLMPLVKLALCIFLLWPASGLVGLGLPQLSRPLGPLAVVGGAGLVLAGLVAYGLVKFTRRLATGTKLTVGPNRLALERGDLVQSWGWGEISNLRLESAHRESWIAFTETLSRQRRALPRDWSIDDDVLLRLLLDAQARHLEHGDYVGPPGPVIIARRPHSQDVRNRLIYVGGAVILFNMLGFLPVTERLSWFPRTFSPPPLLWYRELGAAGILLTGLAGFLFLVAPLFYGTRAHKGFWVLSPLAAALLIFTYWGALRTGVAVQGGQVHVRPEAPWLPDLRAPLSAVTGIRRACYAHAGRYGAGSRASFVLEFAPGTELARFNDDPPRRIDLAKGVDQTNLAAWLRAMGAVTAALPRNIRDDRYEYDPECFTYFDHVLPAPERQAFRNLVTGVTPRGD